MSLRLSITFVLSATLALSCAVNPVNRRPELILTSKDTERSLGEREAAKVEATMGLVEDPELNAYVEAIGKRLIAHAPTDGFEFHFHVVNMKEPNAFALPGGHVYVSRGILALANSEDALAGVIGHEIGHVVGRHAGGRITLGAPLKIVTGIGAAATGIVSPMIGNLIGGIGGATEGILLSPYDRQQERDADRYGAELAAAAGWDPAALPEILHGLERMEDLMGNEGGLAFFSSHPRTPERVRNTSEYAATLTRAKGTPIAPNHAAFLAKLNGLVLGDDPAHGVFHEELFIQPDMGFSLQFPAGWKTMNAPTQVGGASPEQDAIAFLEIVGKGDDPNETAQAIARERGLDADKLTHGLSINGLPAVRSRRVTGRNGRQQVTLEATWIAFDHGIYQIVCATTPDKIDAYHSDFLRIPHSFRAATNDDRARVKARRLRTRKARAGETVAQLVERTGSEWNGDIVAVANGIETDTVLSAGTPIKVAIEEPYRPK